MILNKKRELIRAIIRLNKLISIHRDESVYNITYQYSIPDY